jgi:transposase
MAKRQRRSFAAEFKADAVRLCQTGNRSVGQVAKDLDLTESALREWMKQAVIDAGKDPKGELTSLEREELGELRRRTDEIHVHRRGEGDVTRGGSLQDTWSLTEWLLRVESAPGIQQCKG